MSSANRPTPATVTFNVTGVNFYLKTPRINTYHLIFNHFNNQISNKSKKTFVFLLEGGLILALKQPQRKRFNI
jgi:hypothetical protein